LIGYEATIMPGIRWRRCNHCYKVLTRDVEAYTIVGGNPAKEIRLRFDASIIQELLGILVDWEIEKLL